MACQLDDQLPEIEERRLVHTPQFITWLKLATTGLGGAGVFLAAFLDSSVLSLPLVTDLLVIQLSSEIPLRMPYYAAAATLGSLAGCIWVYFLARKGGESYYRKRQGRSPGPIRNWVRRNAVLSVLIPAVLPPPVPFKPFVLAEGVFQVPLPQFVAGILVGRGCRFFLEGLLGFFYGAAAEQFFFRHKFSFLGILLGLVVAGLAAKHWFQRRSVEAPAGPANSVTRR